MNEMELIQLRHLFDVVSGSTPASGEAEYWDGDINWVTPEDMTRLTSSDGVLYDTKRKITKEGYNNANLTLVTPGSIVLSKRAPIGQVATLGMEACCNQGCFLLKPKENILPKFYFYYLHSFTLWLQALGRGSTFMELSTDDLKSWKVHVPTLEEQQKITDYLDRETARIDTLIHSKERLLKLLAEKRQAFITRAVTRGLDDNTPVNYSGLEWLGEVPAHWEIIRLKFLSDIYYGLSQPPTYYPDGLPFIRATNVFRGSITKEGLVYVDAHELPASKTIVLEEGDIIVVRSGAYTADSALVTGDWRGAIAGFDMVVRPSQKIYAAFLAWAFLAEYVLTSQLIPMSTRAAQPHLNAEELGSVMILVPSLTEQYQIVAAIRRETERIDAIKKATERTIALLNERRAALISSVVTGKLDYDNQTN